MCNLLLLVRVYGLFDFYLIWCKNWLVGGVYVRMRYVNNMRLFLMHHSILVVIDYDGRFI
jgi:hypothetical protein